MSGWQLCRFGSRYWLHGYTRQQVMYGAVLMLHRPWWQLWLMGWRVKGVAG